MADKKSLYDKHERLTGDGFALEVTTIKTLGILFVIYMQKGYTAREISHVIEGAVHLLETEKVIK